MSAKTDQKLTFKEILDKSAASAFRGGLAGACAMGANVACLMWMRTTVCWFDHWLLPVYSFLSGK